MRMPISTITPQYVEREWEESVGEKFWLDHYREPAPGKRHAECASGERLCKVHSDKQNPHASIPDAVEHFVDSDMGFAITIGGLMLAAILGAAYLSGRLQNQSPTNISQYRTF